MTAGIVLEPTNNISLAVDYFNIKLEEVISQGIPAATILSDLGRYGSLITRGAPQVVGGVTIPGPIIDIDQTNINLGRAYLVGFDVDFRAATPVGTYGQLGFSLNGTYFTKYDTQNPDGSFTSVLDTANNNTGGVVVRWRHYAAATWTYGPLALTFAQQFQKKYDDLPGSFEDPTDPAFVPRKVGAYEIYHLQGVYNGFKNLTLTLGAQHLRQGPAVHECWGPDIVSGRIRPAVCRSEGPLLLRSRHLQVSLGQIAPNKTRRQRVLFLDCNARVT